MAAPYVMAEAAWTGEVDPNLLFADGFDAGDSCTWTDSVVGGCTP